ncbi:glycosyltransferase [Tessaracoccus sp. MC1679]|uniref:glycosyltransferase n=1 Tax=Tessaracoccus sp. MC1679 TaxID=2760313 RepID=UPI0015FEF3BE|nr:glycosyltransferase [Tessaracoccus sp. MC1679]MBB1514778.1 glycosyltransferase [Tessaracoccus sp. MC1679]
MEPIRGRVRHLTSVHDIGDTRISHKECRSLLEAGYDVALISCHDGDTRVGDVPVVGLGRPRNRIERIFLKTWQILARALRDKADIYHFHDPELMGVGLALRLCGKKVVYDVHEDVPLQIANKTWIPVLLKRPLSGLTRVLETVAGRSMSAIVAATPSIAEKFPATRTVTVQNFPEKGLALERNPIPFGERRYAFVYVGGLSEQQGLFEMLRAFEQLPEGATGVLAGKFKQFRSTAEAMPGWTHVHYPGLLARDGVVAALRDAKVGIVLNHPISNYLEGYSTKMFEYMACGLPVIASNFELWHDILSGADCGVTVDPFDEAAVAAALLYLLDHPRDAERMGENGRQAILNRYNWDVEFEKLLACYRAL